MRFKKGTKVEVLSNSGGPLGSWMCGEIVNGNGRYYTVKYHSNCFTISDAMLGRVARCSIRPSPPVLDVKRWAPGHIVEVRCDISWKLASVLQAIDKDNYLVKFMGYAQDFRVHKSDIRPRLVWQDENWVLIGKGRQVVRSNMGGGNDAKDDNFKSLVSGIVSSKTLKRASPYRSSLIVSARKKLKIGAGENVGSVAYPPMNWGEKVTKPSFNVGTPACHDLCRESSNCFECSPTRSHGLNASHTVASSVGSCSFPSGRGNELLSSDTAALSSDADSLCSGGQYDGMFTFSRNETLAAERYRLELHEYHKILEAFNSSGSISWEKEELLTDLRISLHISDDDHLTKLKRQSAVSIVQHVN